MEAREIWIRAPRRRRPAAVGAGGHRRSIGLGRSIRLGVELRGGPLDAHGCHGAAHIARQAGHYAHAATLAAALELAGQVVTLDQISNGRAILAVGLGAVDDVLGSTGEITDLRTRAEMMDEGIDLIAGLWNQQLRYDRQHYRVNLEARTDLASSTASVQQPRVPIWVVGAWPRPKSMERVLRCDGLIPQAMDANGPREMRPDDVPDIIAWLREHGRSIEGFDIITEGETPADVLGDRRGDRRPLD